MVVFDTSNIFFFLLQFFYPFFFVEKKKEKKKGTIKGIKAQGLNTKSKKHTYGSLVVAI